MRVKGFALRYFEYIKQSLTKNIDGPAVSDWKEALLFSAVPACALLVLIFIMSIASPLDGWNFPDMDILLFMAIPVSFIFIVSYCLILLKLRRIYKRYKLGVDKQLIFRSAANYQRSHAPFLIAAYLIAFVQMTICDLFLIAFSKSATSAKTAGKITGSTELVYSLAGLSCFILICYILIKAFVCVNRKISFQVSNQFDLRRPLPVRSENVLKEALQEGDIAAETRDAADACILDGSTRIKSWKQIIIEMVPVTLASMAAMFYARNTLDRAGKTLVSRTSADMICDGVVLAFVLAAAFFPLSYVYFYNSAKRLKKSFPRLQNEAVFTAFRKLLFFNNSTAFVSWLSFFVIYTVIVFTFCIGASGGSKDGRFAVHYLILLWVPCVCMFVVFMPGNMKRREEKAAAVLKKAPEKVVIRVEAAQNQARIVKHIQTSSMICPVIAVIGAFFAIGALFRRLTEGDNGNVSMVVLEDIVFLGFVIFVTYGGLSAYLILKRKELSLVGSDFKKLGPEKLAEKLVDYKDIDLVRLYDLTANCTAPLLFNSLSDEMIKRGLAEKEDFVQGANFYTAPIGRAMSTKADIYMTNKFIRVEQSFPSRPIFIRIEWVESAKIVIKNYQGVFSRERMIELSYRRMNKLKKQRIASVDLNIWIAALKTAGVEVAAAPR